MQGFGNWPREGAEAKGQKRVRSSATISNKQFYDLFMKTFRFVLEHCGLCWMEVPLILSFAFGLFSFVMSLFAKSTAFYCCVLLSLRNVYGSEWQLRSSPACATRSRPKNQREFLRNSSSIISEAVATCKNWIILQNARLTTRLLFDLEENIQTSRLPRDSRDEKAWKVIILSRSCRSDDSLCRLLFFLLLLVARLDSATTDDCRLEELLYANLRPLAWLGKLHSL